MENWGIQARIAERPKIYKTRNSCTSRAQLPKALVFDTSGALILTSSVFGREANNRTRATHTIK